MKTLIAVFLGMILIASCNNNEAEQKEPVLKQASDTVMAPELHTELYGTYIGNFEDGRNAEVIADDTIYIEPVKISLQITHITEKGANGKSLLRGNDRPMAGQLTKAGNAYKFVMDEPGTDKHDGRFNFTINGDSLTGVWEAYDKTIKGPIKKFLLVKTPFQYNANLMLPNDWDYVDYTNAKSKSELYTNEDGTVDTVVYDYYRAASDAAYTLNASKQKLTEKQLKNLKKLDLEILRNTIFARHGYSFKSKGVRQFFDQVAWYIPVSANVTNDLTDVEKENISLLQRFEKYAADNYDTFGR